MSINDVQSGLGSCSSACQRYGWKIHLYLVSPYKLRGYRVSCLLRDLLVGIHGTSRKPMTNRKSSDYVCHTVGAYLRIQCARLHYDVGKNITSTIALLETRLNRYPPNISHLGSFIQNFWKIGIHKTIICIGVTWQLTFIYRIIYI